MIKESDIKSQRDRFLAFSFAGADLLLEIDAAGRVVFSSGAVRSLTGFDEAQLKGASFLSIFSRDDVSLLTTIRAKAKAGIKQGPYLVSLLPFKGNQNPVKVFVSVFSMPKNPSLYLAISKGDSLLRIMGFEKDIDDKNTIADSKKFETLVQKKIPELIASGQDADLTLLQLEGIAKHQKKLDKEDWKTFMESVAELVMESSLDGETAADLNDGRYVILQKDAQQNEKLKKKIKELAKEYDLGNALEIKSKTIEGDLPNLSEREATRAILYTMNQMEEGGVDKTGDDLKKSFKSYLEENTQKIKVLKGLISHQRFQIHFQPIVDLTTTKVAHHEVLVRFEGNQSPYELIVLGEDIGISSDIDLAVCRQAIKFSDMNLRGTRSKIAVNLSGASVQSDTFIDTILETLHGYPEAASHIMFEITESANIKDLDRVNKLIQRLRKDNHKVCLDDFGAGSASFQYLHRLHVDGVKIDGAYTKSILHTPRDATMIKNLTQMCHELDIFVVAEFVETEQQARYLRDIGVDKGQGWLFGKPSPKLLSDK